MNKNLLVVILGPTASGKTSLAIDLAKKFDTEIISADSRQFFREMNIGTAKPSAKQLQSVKHHFINSLSVKDEYNVGAFEKEALHAINTIFQKRNIAILAGGSGLYINAVCNGFDDIPKADKKIREQLSILYKEKDIEGLRERLKALDEDYYKKIDISNPHRLIRAIEVCLITGIPYSSLRKGKKQTRNFTTIKIGLNTERSNLYKIINERVDDMMNNGLLEEVKSLAEYKNINSLQTVGYKELFEYLEGTINLERAVELIKQNTRNFAKRQLTWFRKDETIKWFGINEEENIISYIKEKADTFN